MRLNTYSNSSFERLEFDFGPFLAKHQVRQIRLTTVRHSLSQVNCRSHSINSSVEKIVLNTTADLSFTRLSMDFLKTARNLKFVLYHFVIYPKLEHLEDLLYNLIDYVRGCLQQSPNLQFIFDIQVKSRDLNDLGCPQFFLGKEHKFVQKKELKDDVDFKSSRNYECEEEMQILVCTANRVKFFIWC
ncbi:hypothetical protein M3Y96_00532000 [Aphelenchoides besseyi]|nr:hypothetical protein M3Y96_00532000 [Aphelenchoides besseyi]